MARATRDADVEALASDLRLAEAADLARARGDLVRALELALEASDLARVELAARGVGAIEDEAARSSTLARARAVSVRARSDEAEGLLLEAVGNVDEALDAYERAGAFARVAGLCLSRGSEADAARALERHLASRPDDDDARVLLARTLLATDRAEAALRALPSRSTPQSEAIRDAARARLGLSDAPPSPAAPTPEGLLFGRYEVVRAVASTPSSRVLQAVDRLAPGAPLVALKIFTGLGHVGAGRDALARFRREISALASIASPFVLRPREVLAEGPTIVLPWMAGGSVADRLAEGALAPSRAIEIAARVLGALDVAHRRGILHRDVKPANVLLDEAGGAFLADFGVAHLGDASATATAGQIGTLRYMAPEQRLGEPATARSDLFAVGVLLADMLGVEPAPDATDATQAWDAIDASGVLGRTLRGLLAQDPSARPAEAAEVRAALLAIHPDDAARIVGARPRSRPPSASLRPTSARRAAIDAGARDLLLERDEAWIALDDPRVALVEALALTCDPALPVVLGLDAASQALRVEQPDGVAMERLDAASATAIRRALGRLHARGVAHGAVERSVRRTSRGAVLALPPPDAVEHASPSRDLLAVERLARA